MCQFFSAIATRDGRLLFTEQDSHETIIGRVGLKDTSLHLRSWARVEALPLASGGWDIRVDETSVPVWFEHARDEWTTRIEALADRIAPARKVYEDTCAPARKVYISALSAIEGYMSSSDSTACSPKPNPCGLV